VTRLVSALCLLVLAVAPSGAAAPDYAAFGLVPYAPPRTAPAFTLPDLEGRPVKLGDYRGKALLLFFWATW
jgi:cytochrome oxidase Cu insertion factor (SCO1/SenC/PrrC family)